MNTNTTTCPDTPDLLDHMEGRLDLSAHFVACEPCSTALSELRAALDVESALVATSPLETERALSAVMTRAKKNRAGTWRTTGLFSAAAAVTLALLLPGNLAPTNAGDGPQGGGENISTLTKPPLGVDAPNIALDQHDQHVKDSILGLHSATTAVVRS